MPRVRRKKGKDVPLYVTEWKVQSVKDRSQTQIPERQTAFIAIEIVKYGINKATLNVKKLPGYNSLVDHGYSFYWSGKLADEKRETGVGFTFKNKIAVTLDERTTPINY